MPLFVKENNSESPSRSTNDSPTESVNGSLFRQKTVHSLFRAEITNGSLLHEDSSFRLKIPQQSQQMAVSFGRRQFAHFLSRQGQQMAVSPSRRQFVPLAIGKWQSFSQEKTVCLLNTQEIDKWQFL